MPPASDGEDKAPERRPPRGPEDHRPAVGRVIPWSGCVPAEPASVSPGKATVPGTGQAGQGGSEGPGVRLTSSLGSPFFGLDNGVHFTGLAVGLSRSLRDLASKTGRNDGPSNGTFLPYQDELQKLGVRLRQQEPGIWRLQGGLIVHPTWVLETEVLAGLEHPLLTLFSPQFLTQARQTYALMRQAGYTELTVYAAQQIQQFRQQGEEFAMQHLGAEDELKQVLRSIMLEMTPQERLTMFTPEELRTILSSDEILAYIPIEQLLARVPPEQRLQGLAPEQRLQGLAPEQRLQGLAPEQRLQGLAPEQRLQGLAPEQMLQGLTPEQREQLRQLLSRPDKDDPSSSK